MVTVRKGSHGLLNCILQPFHIVIFPWPGPGEKRIFPIYFFHEKVLKVLSGAIRDADAGIFQIQ
ncbi:MAG: hypothetical protein V8Q57_08050, partial [Blautia sp.]